MAGKKQKILGRDDFFKMLLVEVPELGGSIYMKSLGGKNLLRYKERIEQLEKTNPEIDAYNALELMAFLVSLVACDETGTAIFTEEDAKLLAETNMFVLQRLSTKALEVSGLPTSAIEEVNSHLKNASKDSSTTTSQEN